MQTIPDIFPKNLIPDQWETKNMLIQGTLQGICGLALGKDVVCIAWGSFIKGGFQMKKLREFVDAARECYMMVVLCWLRVEVLQDARSCYAGLSMECVFWNRKGKCCFATTMSIEACS